MFGANTQKIDFLQNQNRDWMDFYASCIQYFSNIWPEHVSGAERKNFLLIAQLHLRESRLPLGSRSDDLPLSLRSCSTWFFEPRLPLRSAHLTFWPAPLRSKARFKGRGGQGPTSLHQQRAWIPLHPLIFCHFSQLSTCVILNFL